MVAAARHAAKSTAPSAATTIGLRAAEVVDQQRSHMRAHLAAALEGSDPEGVHDMRVASRRLRAALQLFRPWIGGAEMNRVAPQVRRVTRALGAVRELDVLRLGLAQLATRASPERALAIEAVDAMLDRRRRRARARMMARFARVDLDRLDHRLRRLAAQLEHRGRSHAAGSSAAVATEPEIAGLGASEGGEKPGSGPVSDAGPLASFDGDENETSAAPGPATSGEEASEPRPARHGTTADGREEPPPAHAPVADLVEFAAPELLAAAHAIVDHPIPDGIGSAAAGEALHEVRIAAKKLRYLFEALAPVLGDPGAKLVKRLRAMQDKLGDFHDDVVLDGTLREALERAVARDRTLLARELRRFRSSRRRAIAREERVVRAALAHLREQDFVGAVRKTLVGAGLSRDAVESLDERARIETGFDEETTAAGDADAADPAPADAPAGDAEAGAAGGGARGAAGGAYLDPAVETDATRRAGVDDPLDDPDPTAHDAP